MLTQRLTLLPVSTTASQTLPSPVVPRTDTGWVPVRAWTSSSPATHIAGSTRRHHHSIWGSRHGTLLWLPFLGFCHGFGDKPRRVQYYVYSTRISTASTISFSHFLSLMQSDDFTSTNYNNITHMASIPWARRTHTCRNIMTKTLHETFRHLWHLQQLVPTSYHQHLCTIRLITGSRRGVLSFPFQDCEHGSCAQAAPLDSLSFVYNTPQMKIIPSHHEFFALIVRSS